MPELCCNKGGDILNLPVRQSCDASDRMTCGHLTEPDPEVRCWEAAAAVGCLAPGGLRVYLLPGPRPGYGRGSDGGATSGRFDPRRPR